jgi:hypothetical protein
LIQNKTPQKPEGFCLFKFTEFINSLGKFINNYFLDLPEIFGGSRKKIAKKNKPIKEAKIKV